MSSAWATTAVPLPPPGIFWNRLSRNGPSSPAVSAMTTDIPIPKPWKSWNLWKFPFSAPIFREILPLLPMETASTGIPIPATTTLPETQLPSLNVTMLPGKIPKFPRPFPPAPIMWSTQIPANFTYPPAGTPMKSKTPTGWTIPEAETSSSPRATFPAKSATRNRRLSRLQKSATLRCANIVTLAPGAIHHQPLSEPRQVPAS